MKHNPIACYFYLIGWVKKNRPIQAQEAPDFASWAYIRTKGFPIPVNTPLLFIDYLRDNAGRSRYGVCRDIGNNCRSLNNLTKEEYHPDYLMLLYIERLKPIQQMVLYRFLSGYSLREIADYSKYNPSRISQILTDIVTTWGNSERIRSDLDCILA